MAKREILVLPDARLRQVAEDIPEVDASVKQLAADMLETMYAAPGIGLAAPQIGESKRIVVMDLSKEGEPPDPIVMINPEIKKYSDETVTTEEGCLSIPEIYYDVERPAEVTVEYTDLEGKRVTQRRQGPARHLHPARARSPRWRALHRLSVAAEARPRAEEIPEGREAEQEGQLTFSGGRRSLRLKIIFMGTPDFAVPTLTEIVSAGHEVVAVYTRAPKPAGRGQAERKSPIHLAAEGFGIPVRTPKSLRNEEAQAEFAALDADVGIVVAYGLILPKPILDAPKLGCLNLHGSLLPRWRGAAPIQRAVLAGDARTGVMVMQMDEGLDTGPVGLVDEMPIGPDMTTGELHDKMMLVGADLMGRALAALERGSLSFTPQTEDGRHLRQEDREGRSAHRLEQAGGRGAQPHPRHVAVPRRLVRAGARRCA